MFQNGFVEVAELLIDAGADLEVKNEDGDTPLMLAVRSEHAAVVDLLCQRGCNMHAHGFDDIDPLDYALNKRNLYLSDVLLKHERQHLNSVSSTNSVDTSITNHLNSPTATKISNIAPIDEIAAVSTPTASTITSDELSANINKMASDIKKLNDVDEESNKNSNSLNVKATETPETAQAAQSVVADAAVPIVQEIAAENQNANDSVFQSED